jgi:hypothetical protein
MLEFDGNQMNGMMPLSYFPLPYKIPLMSMGSEVNLLITKKHEPSKKASSNGYSLFRDQQPSNSNDCLGSLSLDLEDLGP